ncbi:MAG: 4-hydroxyphenylpyruvate dioxygenase [Castellaniella sp.]|uniref:VOC family protein n=1 Tax=Castellaniella sp. TaxID=1955812 RepID=UPI00122B7424|nr:VOC family protein [Castellaniella sp.]TAN30768.1 MAG: 4-hydroxyphenylpyruvate dioxygenase [Castellaniella sp.]
MTRAGTEESNPLGMQGIEFVEYLSRHPDELGGVLAQLGFRLIARHRSRAVFLYRQGSMNIIINADEAALSSHDRPDEGDQINAVALRVADANLAYRRCMQWGAWPIPTRADVMELNIPGIHGVGDSVIYLVDHRRNVSIYDVDFEYVSDEREVPTVVPGLHFFGLVQYINPDRTAEWIDFYAQLLGFRALPPDTHFGILPNGTILQSPCGHFYLQLVEPMGDALFDVEWYEQFARLAFGTPDVALTVRSLEARGVPFENNEFSRPDSHGAVTSGLSYDVNFELVRQDPAPPPAGDQA